MFKEVNEDLLETFRLIYHQTTGYSNPIIESVLYQNRLGCGIYYWGDITDGNYMIFHRSGFSHINFNPFDKSLNDIFFKQLDFFIKNNPTIPNYLMFFNTPSSLINYWKNQNKEYFKIRTRRRYQIDEIKFMELDKSLYAIPSNHDLLPLQNCSEDEIAPFDPSIWNKFYNSSEDFLKNSFGFVMRNEYKKPVSISFLSCYVGRNSECSLLTLPEYRNKSYGFINITNYVKESINRKVNVGWDCFIENHTNEWIKLYGYTHIIREYDFVSFLK